MKAIIRFSEECPALSFLVVMSVVAFAFLFAVLYAIYNEIGLFSR